MITRISNFLLDAFAMLILAIFAFICIGVASSPVALIAMCVFG